MASRHRCKIDSSSVRAHFPLECFPMVSHRLQTNVAIIGLSELAHSRDASAFNRLRSFINRPGDIPSSTNGIKGYNGHSSPTSQPLLASPYGVKRPSNHMAMPSYQGKRLARTGKGLERVRTEYSKDQAVTNIRTALSIRYKNL